MSAAPNVRVEYIARRVGTDEVNEFGRDIVKAREAVNFWNTLPFTCRSPYYLVERTITERPLEES